MKRCPECRRDYTDDTLNFCLADGTELVYGLLPDEPATAVLHSTDASGDAPTRAQINTTAQTAVVPFGINEINKKAFDRRVLVVPFLLAIVVLGGFYGYRYFAGASKQIESVAVMPFANESGNADVEYLSDGMTETLINSLSQIPNLSVKARSSVFRYKGREIDPNKVASELGVQAILTGRLAAVYKELICKGAAWGVANPMLGRPTRRRPVPRPPVAAGSAAPDRQLRDRPGQPAGVGGDAPVPLAVHREG